MSAQIWLKSESNIGNPQTGSSTQVESERTFSSFGNVCTEAKSIRVLDYTTTTYYTLCYTYVKMLTNMKYKYNLIN